MTKLIISVGRLGFRLSGLNDQICQELNQRYQAFTGTKDDNVVFNIDYELVNETQNTIYEQEEVKFTDGIAYLNSSNIVGMFDISKGVSRVSSSKKSILEGIDYTLRFALALVAFNQGCILLHAAGIIRANFAYLFVGHSGSGKTTVSRLSQGNTILSDDLVLIQPTQKGQGKSGRLSHALDSEWWVSSTPFKSAPDIEPVNEYAPLKAIFHLVQDKVVFLEEMAQSQAIAEILANIPVITKDVNVGSKLIQTVANITDTIQIRKLHFLPDFSFWNIID